MLTFLTLLLTLLSSFPGFVLLLSIMKVSGRISQAETEP